MSRRVWGREAMSRFLKSPPDKPGAEASFDAAQEPPNLQMFERQDWTLFRTIEACSKRPVCPRIICAISS